MINNYWMRLSVISRIIKASVGVICQKKTFWNDGCIYWGHFIQIIRLSHFNNLPDFVLEMSL